MSAKKLRSRTKTSRRMNLHHLAWPRTQYNGIRKQARELPCLQVYLDIEVHRVLHDMYNFPKLMKEEDAALLVGRHKAHVCACYDANGLRRIGILSINEQEEDDGGDDEAA